MLYSIKGTRIEKGTAWVQSDCGQASYCFEQTHFGVVFKEQAVFHIASPQMVTNASCVYSTRSALTVETAQELYSTHL